MYVLFVMFSRTKYNILVSRNAPRVLLHCLGPYKSRGDVSTTFCRPLQTSLGSLVRLLGRYFRKKYTHKHARVCVNVCMYVCMHVRSSGVRDSACKVKRRMLSRYNRTTTHGSVTVQCYRHTPSIKVTNCIKI